MNKIISIIGTVVAGLVIIAGTLIYIGHDNKSDKIEKATSIKRYSNTTESTNKQELSSSSSIVASSSPSEPSVATNTNDTYSNAYGHTLKKGETDNTGIAQNDRDRNIDIENVKYLVTSNLNRDDKLKQIQAWGLSLTPMYPSKNNSIWARDKKTDIGKIDENGNVTLN